MQIEYGLDSGSNQPGMADFIPAGLMDNPELARPPFVHPAPWAQVEMPYGDIQNLLGNFSEQTGAQFG